MAAEADSVAEAALEVEVVAALEAASVAEAVAEVEVAIEEAEEASVAVEEDPLEVGLIAVLKTLIKETLFLSKVKPKDSEPNTN